MQVMNHQGHCLAAVFSDISFCRAAMAYLFNSAGRQMVLGLAKAPLH